MIQNNIINNIDLDKLPEDVQYAMYIIFKELPLKERIIILSKLTHGTLFKLNKQDIIKLQKTSVSKIYNSYIDLIKQELGD